MSMRSAFEQKKRQQQVQESAAPASQPEDTAAQLARKKQIAKLCGVGAAGLGTYAFLGGDKSGFKTIGALGLGLAAVGIWVGSGIQSAALEQKPAAPSALTSSGYRGRRL